jgi:ABC-type glycerol-3-phosphate transport system substrate-binding protein
MMVYWAPPVYYLNNASRSSVAGDFMVAPMMPGGYSILGGTGLGVAANSQNKQLAVEFVTFATGQAEGGYWNALNNLVPFRYSAFAASIAAHPDLAAMLNNVASTMANSLQGSANVPLWPQISTAFRTTLPLIYQNKTSLADGVNTMMQEIASSAP